MPTSILNRSMNRLALSPIVSVTAAMLVVVGTRSNAARANVTAGCSPGGLHVSFERRLESIQRCIGAAALKKTLAENGSTAAAPKHLQRNVGIARFVRRQAHERHRTSGFEGYAGDVLLFRGVNHLKAGLHSG